jgi:AcrR family transcriptional regulator
MARRRSDAAAEAAETTTTQGQDVNTAGSAARIRRAGDGVADSMSLREFRRGQRLAVGREQILDTAEELFGAQGYQRTSVEQIAKGSEFSAGGVYNFFENKQDILHAVLARRGNDEVALMESCLELDVPGDEMLLRIVRVIIEFHRRYPAFGRLSARITAMPMDALPEVKPYAAGLNHAYGVFATAIERGQREGTIRQGDAHSLAQLVARLVSAHHAVDPELSDARPGISTAEILEIVRNALTPVAAG